MLQVVPKWRVTASGEGFPETTLWLHDYNLPNVLRTVAGIQFTENGLGGPDTVTVSRCAEPANVSKLVSTFGPAANADERR